jgi:hypothetical protein
MIAVAILVFYALDTAFWQTALGRGFRSRSVWYLLPGGGIAAFRKALSAGEKP